nr:MAG TPA: hypothetical protein [Caudoviricetes sp.]
MNISENTGVQFPSAPPNEKTEKPQWFPGFSFIFNGFSDLKNHNACKKIT